LNNFLSIIPLSLKFMLFEFQLLKKKSKFQYRPRKKFVSRFIRQAKFYNLLYLKPIYFMETEEQQHSSRRGQGKPVSIKERWKIVLDLNKGLSMVEVAKLHQRPRRTCDSIYQKYKETGDVVDLPKTGGAKKKIEPDYVPRPPRRNRREAKTQTEEKILKDVGTQTTLSWNKIARKPKGKPIMSAAWIAFKGLKEKNLKEKWISNQRN